MRRASAFCIMRATSVAMQRRTMSYALPCRQLPHSWNAPDVPRCCKFVRGECDRKRNKQQKRIIATTWRSCHSCQSQDTAQMDETRQSIQSCCVLAAWRRMSQHCNPRSAATTRRSCHHCQSQDTAQMDETRQMQPSFCALAAWRRMQV